MALIGNFKGQMLWENIDKGDLTAVVNLLENGNINLEDRDATGQTFLMVACQKGEVTMVREILEAGSDPNAIDNDNWTALMYAARLGFLEICIELLEREASIDHRDLLGWTALMWASYKGHDNVVLELLDHGTDPNVKAEHNMTCLMWASGRGHTGIAKILVQKGGRVNSTDKYGTTALIWACRKGFLEIVLNLLQNGAHVDNTGMDSLTALLVATRGGYGQVVQALLENNPNVNAVDKDGFTALTIAAKEGYFDITQELLAHDAYVNIVDRAGDTILIHAVKGGHIDVVRALLNRFAAVDVEGNERKTALYWAVEKGHTQIVKLLLGNEPDQEIATKEGDTCLMRAVRNRQEDIVRLMLDKGARVSAVDKKGDTALHISLRARSKRITELLLRNPRNSRLLYRPNKNGETAYSIDAYHHKSILSQIHGHRKLNASDGENLLGYEIYSSALADILSEPTLNTPITVGLYAKWGSGKSFLLSKLQTEMRSFTKANKEEFLEFTWSLFIILLILNVLVGSVLALALHWEVGLAVGGGLFVFQYGFLGLMWFCSMRYNVRFARRISQAIGKKITILTLLLKVLFCNPTPRQTEGNSITVPLVRFLFSDNTRLSSVGGEKALAAMVASLSESLENEFGFLSTRLFSVLKPTAELEGTHIGRFKTICCIPVFAILVFFILCLAVGFTLLIIYKISDNTVVNGVMIGLACVVGLTLLSNIHKLGKAVVAVFISQRRRIMKAADSLHILKMGGFMHKLKNEVTLMNNLVRTMDKFTGNTTRLTVIVDGLDSCEQDKVLQVLDIIQGLFNDEASPFVTILAVDPQVIIKGIEQNLSTMFQDSGVNGFDYLRNIVHLPFYLQSQGLKVQKEEMAKSLSVSDVAHGSESPQKVYRHQDSTVSQISGYSVTDPAIKRVGNQQRKREDSVGTVYHSNFDLSHTLTKNDYFSDINPRSMRRLMNIVAVTGRLLRAYNIDFNWHRLASWINIVEQWPYRLSWIILHFEENEGLDDDTTLKSIYYKIAAQIPVSSEIDPLLEIDRSTRKLEAFLSSKAATAVLNIRDLKKFLPCTINLDPYLRKLIRNQQQTTRQTDPMAMFGMSPNAASRLNNDEDGVKVRASPMKNTGRQSQLGNIVNMPYMQYGHMGMSAPMVPMMNPYYMGMMQQHQQQQLQQQQQQQSAVLEKEVTEVALPRHPRPNHYIKNYKNERLSQMSMSDISDLLNRLHGIHPKQLPSYREMIEENNISGRVLSVCDLDELGKVLNMKFGDWQLFRSTILSLREAETSNLDHHLEMDKLETSPKSEYYHESSVLTNGGTSEIDGSWKPKSVSVFSKQGSVEQGEGSESASQFDVIQEERFEEVEKEQEEQTFKQSMRRNDSVVAELMYESGLLEQAMKSFVEPVGEDDEDEEEEIEEQEDSTGNNKETPSSRKRGLPVQFTLLSYPKGAESREVSPESKVSEEDPAPDSISLLSRTDRAGTESPNMGSKSILKKRLSSENLTNSSNQFPGLVSVHSEPDVSGKKRDSYIEMEAANLESSDQFMSNQSWGFTHLGEYSTDGGRHGIVRVENEMSDFSNSERGPRALRVRIDESSNQSIQARSQFSESLEFADESTQLITDGQDARSSDKEAFL